MRGLKL